MNQKKSKIYFTALLASLLFSFLPILAFFHGLVKSGMWRNALASLQGKYVDKLTGIPSPLWIGSLWILLFAGLYVGAAWSALKVVNYKLGDRLYRARITVSIGLILFGTIVLAITTFFASFAYVFYGDVLFGGIFAPNSVFAIGITSLLSLIVNIYFVIKLNRESKQRINNTLP